MREQREGTWGDPLPPSHPPSPLPALGTPLIPSITVARGCAAVPPPLHGRMGTERFRGTSWRGGDCDGVALVARHSLARHGTHAPTPGTPAPPAAVQLFPGPPLPLAAACVWKVMNFCTN